jgi:hypothetical protein
MARMMVAQGVGVCMPFLHIAHDWLQNVRPPGQGCVEQACSGASRWLLRPLAQRHRFPAIPACPMLHHALPIWDSSPGPPACAHEARALRKNAGVKCPTMGWMRLSSSKLPHQASLCRCRPSHRCSSGPCEQQKGLMAVLWAVAVLIWQIWQVVGQSYPSCSVSCDSVAEYVLDAPVLNS